jgi:hypothetical protein
MSKSRTFGEKSVTNPCEVPLGIDSTTFFNPQIPYEVKSAVPLMHSCQIEVIRICIDVVLSYLETKKFDENEFIKFQTKIRQKNVEFSVLFTGIFSVLRLAVSLKISRSVLVTTLTSMNVPSLVIEEIVVGLMKARKRIESCAVEQRIGLRSLRKMRWRIDIAISSCALARVMRPTIIMQLILDDGSVRIFEISLEKFNELRYGVAKVLSLLCYF